MKKRKMEVHEMLFWISLVLFAISLLGLIAMIGCWVYADAKRRSDKPLVWTLIAVLTPNLFGVLIYLLVGRTKSKPEHVKSRFIIPLIAFAACFVLSTGLFLGSVFMSVRLPVVGGVSIGMVNNNIGNQWGVSFKTSGDEFTREIELSDAGLKTFNVQGSCEEGELYLLIRQKDVVKVIDLSDHALNSLDLSGYQPGKVTLVLYNDHARNAKVKITWER
jgi:hypothetical protein